MFYRLVIPVILFSCLCAVRPEAPAAEDSGVWLDIPFVKQEKNGCGAASIAMVMKYWLNRRGGAESQSIDAAEIHRALYDSGARGVYASSMERYFKQQGFIAFAFRGEWDDLLNHLRKGRPLIVALRPSWAGEETGAPLHYVVMAGLAPAEGLVLLNDPAQRKLLKQDRTDFEKQWSGANKWTLLALPQTNDK
ncbi:MAG: C39 family peptidase [Chloracidobacterium sp.]|nr:C39 family peptidase [Chloracidobacterium sp.]